MNNFPYMYDKIMLYEIDRRYINIQKLEIYICLEFKGQIWNMQVLDINFDKLKKICITCR